MSENIFKGEQMESQGARVRTGTGMKHPTGWHAVLIALFFFTGTCSAYAEGVPPGAERFIPPGMYIEDQQRGDLTGDKLDDLVLILGDRKDNISSSTIMVVLMQRSDGSFEKIGSNDKLPSLERDDGPYGGILVAIEAEGALDVDRLGDPRSQVQVDDMWRFRFDPNQRRMRLIRFHHQVFDSRSGNGTKESINYLTGKRITKTYSDTKPEGVVTKSQTTSVATPTIFLEQVTPERLR